MKGIEAIMDSQRMDADKGGGGGSSKAHLGRAHLRIVDTQAVGSTPHPDSVVSRLAAINDGHVPASIVSGDTDGDLNARFYVEGLATMTQDFPAVVNSMIPDIFGDNLSEEKKAEALSVANRSITRFVNIVALAFPERQYQISQELIDASYTKRIAEVLTNKPEAIVVIADKLLAQGVELQEGFEGRVFRFSLTRKPGNLNNNKTDTQSVSQPRPGDPSFDEQRDKIEARLNQEGKTIRGTEVIVADDVTTTMGTIRQVGELFAERGATFNEWDAVLNYRIFKDRYRPEEDIQNSNGVTANRFLSAEEREFRPDMGGTTVQIGQAKTIAYGPAEQRFDEHGNIVVNKQVTLGRHIALQNPPAAPFGDGKMMRVDGYLHRSEIDREVLDATIRSLNELESALNGQLRRDGTPFDGFTFEDYRLAIPVGKDPVNFGPSHAIRAYRETHGEAPRSLRDIKMVDYLKLAREKLNDTAKPTVTHIVEDLDGTIRTMRFTNRAVRGFRNSELGRHVGTQLKRLISEYNGDPGRNGPPLDVKDPEYPMDILQDEGFRAFLEGGRANYRHTTETALQQRFRTFYGAERGGAELAAYKAKYAFLPEAFHVMRQETWGTLDPDAVFEGGYEQALHFNERVLDQGGTLLFVSAAPLIHTMDILMQTDQAHLVREGRVHVVTVEDLYDREDFEELPKRIVFEALREGPVHDRTIEELTEKYASDPLLRDRKRETIRTRIQELKADFLAKGIPLTHPNRILGIGDQNSDIRSAIATGESNPLFDPSLQDNSGKVTGGYGFLVDGPQHLGRVLRYADVTSERNALQKAAALGDPEATRRLEEIRLAEIELELAS